MAIVPKAGDDIRIKICFKSSREKKINELLLTSNKLANNFVDLAISCLRQMWPAGRQLEDTGLVSNRKYYHSTIFQQEPNNFMISTAYLLLQQVTSLVH
jgi:hypothetical protein